MSLTLYHASPSRSSTILWLLEEIGQPYDVQRVDIRDGRHRHTDFMTINPLGKVPTIVHDGAEFEAYVARLDARPARKRAQEKDAALKAKLG